MDKRELQETILSRYDEIARAFARAPAPASAPTPARAPARAPAAGPGAGGEVGVCCGPPSRGGQGPRGEDPPGHDTGGIPPAQSGLGCARLADLIDLFPGETLLDLGSGPGLETITLARLVDPGRAYGLDALPSMVEVATENARRAAATNVTFITGTMEAVPLEDEAVDAVVSNCVINLSQDKERVATEIWRVLRPGGRVAIADMVWLEAPPPWVRDAARAWACCLGGALEVGDYPTLLEKAGFADVNVRLLWTLDPAGLLTATPAPPPMSTGTPPRGATAASCCGGAPGLCCEPAPAAGADGGTTSRPDRALPDGILADRSLPDRTLPDGALPALGGALVTGRKPGFPDAQVSIREVGPSDLPLIEHILQAARLPTAGVAEHLSSFVLACTPEGQVIGVAGLERYRSCALLRSLVVLPTWRGRGLGRRLVEYQIAPLSPGTAVFLLTTDAQAYFRRLGFTPVPRHHAPGELSVSAEFRGACPESATLMEYGAG